MSNTSKYTGKYTGKSNIPTIYRSNHQVVAPSFNPQSYQTPVNIIPRYSKNHNVAGQVKTVIRVKDCHGNEMTMAQVQQMVNLLNGNTQSWKIGNNQINHYRKKRR